MKYFVKIILLTVGVFSGNMAWGAILPDYMHELNGVLLSEDTALQVELLAQKGEGSKYTLHDAAGQPVACLEIRSTEPNYKFHIRSLESDDIAPIITSDDVALAVKSAYIAALLPDTKAKWALELYGIRNSDSAAPNGRHATLLSYVAVCPDYHRQEWVKIVTAMSANNSWQLNGEYADFLKLLDKLIDVAEKVK